MNNWENVTLKDILEPKGYIRGPFGSALKRNELKDIGIPVYEQQHAIYDKRIFRYFIDEKKYLEMQRFSTEKDDLIISCSGTVGKVSIIRLGDPKGIISQALLLLRVNQNIVMPEYLKYYFTSYVGYNSIVSKSSGSVQVNIAKRSVIENIAIKLPSKFIQEKIVQTLSCLDDKIEINNKINEKLEEMAQAIFKSWFVDFEPFKDREFIDSELGRIPKFFKLCSLYDFADYINGASFKKDEYADSGIPIVKIAELKNGITESTKYFKGTKDIKYFISNKDILFSWSGNPDTSIDIFLWRNGNAILNQHTFKVIPKDNNYGFTYLLLKYFKSEFSRIASNKQTTGLGHVTISDLKRLLFVYDNKTIKDFEIVIKPFIDLMFNNLVENEKLTKIRDTLLPKLISGEIDVSDI